MFINKTQALAKAKNWTVWPTYFPPICAECLMIADNDLSRFSKPKLYGQALSSYRGWSGYGCGIWAQGFHRLCLLPLPLSKPPRRELCLFLCHCTSMRASEKTVKCLSWKSMGSALPKPLDATRHISAGKTTDPSGQQSREMSRFFSRMTRTRMTLGKVQG